MSPFVLYSALRLVLFLVVILVLYLLGARDILLVIEAALISAALSYLLLRRPREALAQRLQQRVEGKLEKGRFEKSVDAGNAAEDADAGREN